MRSATAGKNRQSWGKQSTPSSFSSPRLIPGSRCTDLTTHLLAETSLALKSPVPHPIQLTTASAPKHKAKQSPLACQSHTDVSNDIRTRKATIAPPASCYRILRENRTSTQRLHHPHYNKGETIYLVQARAADQVARMSDTEGLGLMLALLGAIVIPLSLTRFSEESILAAAIANEQSLVANQLALISLCLDHAEANLVRERGRVTLQSF